jgi:hypothetical protein
LRGSADKEVRVNSVVDTIRAVWATLGRRRTATAPQRGRMIAVLQAHAKQTGWACCVNVRPKRRERGAGGPKKAAVRQYAATGVRVVRSEWRARMCSRMGGSGSALLWWW